MGVIGEAAVPGRIQHPFRLIEQNACSRHTLDVLRPEKRNDVVVVADGHDPRLRGRRPNCHSGGALQPA
jgi:hypothetical protein